MKLPKNLPPVEKGAMDMYIKRTKKPNSSRHDHDRSPSLLQQNDPISSEDTAANGNNSKSSPRLAVDVATQLQQDDPSSSGEYTGANGNSPKSSPRLAANQDLICPTLIGDDIDSLNKYNSDMLDYIRYK